MTQNGVSSVVSAGKKELPRSPLSLEKPIPDSFSCFCATAVFRIQNGLLEFAYVPYRRNGIGSSVIKLAGGMGKKGESPLRVIAREIHEELGLEWLDKDKEELGLKWVSEKDFQFCFATSPLADPKHIKIFFVVTAEIKEQLRDTPYDAETGVPRWASPRWLKDNLFGAHKEVFPKAIDFLLRHFMEQKNLEGLAALVKSGLIKGDNEEAKKLLLERALEDSKFALAHADELEALGVGGGGYYF